MFDFSYANILHSNVINFAVMIGFFAILGWFLKVPEKLEMYKNSIKKTVEDSDLLKEEAKAELDKVSDSLKNIDEELDAIVRKAHETAVSFEVKAKADIEKSVERIKTNIEKRVSSEEHQIQAQLMKNISASSIEAAHRQIKTALDGNSELHKKYINEFIDNLDKIDM